jgi:hypothetical protein
MALLYQADIRPTKLALLGAWLPGRSWYRGPAGATLTRVAACRFDDPAGAVGIETILVRAADGPIHHTPLTYRDAPLAGAEAWLLGTTEHSVLGTRWVYDACGDPVYAAALAEAIRTGGGQAEEYLEANGRRERREPAMTVIGSGLAGPAATTVSRVVDGDPTMIVTDSLVLSVRRILDGTPEPAAGTLTAAWPEGPGPVVLAGAEPA